MPPGPFRDPFGPHLPGLSSIPLGDVAALQKELAVEDVAAVIVEPIMGEGGVLPLPQVFVEALGDLCDRHKALLVADEVQTGLGRTGWFLYSRHWRRRPDMVCLGKGLGGGLMPLAATLTSSEIFQQAYGQQFEAAESHSATFTFNALSSVAGLVALDLLTEEFLAEVRDKGQRFKQTLHESLRGSPLFKEVRGDGLMLGIECNDLNYPGLSFESFGFEDFADRPVTGALMCMRLYRRGYICYLCNHRWDVLRLHPRLNIEWEKLEQFAKICREEMDYLEGLT